MKGVVIAGGLGTRLNPITLATNKHLLPVYDRPMIFYPIQTLVKAGIKEIMVVTGGPHAGHFISVLKNGKDLGVKHLEFAYQDSESGIAHALRLCEDFADKKSIAVILGDNTTDADISREVKSFKDGAMIFLKKVPDPQRYGVPVFDKRRQIVTIEEKPKNPKSEFAVTGLYFYDDRVFDYIRSIKQSARGELEITDLNNCYIKDGKMNWANLEGFWSDAGTFKSLFLTNQHWAKQAK